MLSEIIVCLIFALHLDVAHAFHINSKSPAVRTQHVTIFGTRNASYPNVDEFLGVPYAVPPLGSLRFMPPKKHCDTDQHQFIDAMKNPPSCWQNPTNPPATIWTETTPFYDIPPAQDEDCLYINIYRPRTCRPDEKLPVIIYVYGGAGQKGSINQVAEYPAPWIERTQDIIVVKIQYRVNIFGYPTAGGLTDLEQNAGYLDIRLGVEWTRDNIEAFGGDPQRMILQGYSAGAAAVDAYNYAYRHDPIVNGFVPESAGVLTPSSFSRDFAHSNFSYVANHFNCSGSDAAQLSCLQGVDAKAIADFLQSGPTSLVFKPIANGESVQWNYTASGLAGNISDKHILYGSNTNEGVRLIDSSTSAAPPNQTMADEVTWFGILCPQVDQTRHLLQSGTPPPIYRYLYAGNFSNISPLPWMGAYHNAIETLMFGTSDFFPTLPPNSAFENETRDYLQDMWRSFAADPSSLQRKAWPLNKAGFPNQTGLDAVNFIASPGGVVNQIINGAYNETLCARFPIPNGTEGVAE